jgi:hypothetical protein
MAGYQPDARSHPKPTLPVAWAARSRLSKPVPLAASIRRQRQARWGHSLAHAASIGRNAVGQPLRCACRAHQERVEAARSAMAQRHRIGFT